MHDLLVGYVLNALDCEERACVEQLLKDDANACRLLEALRHCLLPLQGDCENCDAPHGLAVRTCAAIRKIRIEKRRSGDAPAE